MKSTCITPVIIYFTLLFGLNPTLNSAAPFRPPKGAKVVQLEEYSPYPEECPKDHSGFREYFFKWLPFPYRLPNSRQPSYPGEKPFPRLSLYSPPIYGHIFYGWTIDDYIKRENLHLADPRGKDFFRITYRIEKEKKVEEEPKLLPWEKKVKLPDPRPKFMTMDVPVYSGGGVDGRIGDYLKILVPRIQTPEAIEYIVKGEDDREFRDSFIRCADYNSLIGDPLYGSRAKSIETPIYYWKEKGDLRFYSEDGGLMERFFWGDGGVATKKTELHKVADCRTVSISDEELKAHKDLILELYYYWGFKQYRAVIKYSEAPEVVEEP